MQPKVIYISGPMSGLPEKNYPRFNQVAKQLRSMGHIVANPADNYKDGRTWEEYLAIDLAQVRRCDVVVTLDGWSRSRGAIEETSEARALGIDVMRLAAFRRNHPAK